MPVRPTPAPQCTNTTPGLAATVEWYQAQAGSADKEEPCEAFLKDLLPQLQKSLFE